MNSKRLLHFIGSVTLGLAATVLAVTLLGLWVKTEPAYAGPPEKPLAVTDPLTPTRGSKVITVPNSNMAAALDDIIYIPYGHGSGDISQQFCRNPENEVIDGGVVVFDAGTNSQVADIKVGECDSLFDPARDVTEIAIDPTSERVFALVDRYSLNPDQLAVIQGTTAITYVEPDLGCLDSIAALNNKLYAVTPNYNYSYYDYGLGHTVYIDEGVTVLVYDLDLTLVTTITIPGEEDSDWCGSVPEMAINPTAGLVYMLDRYSNTIQIIDSASDTLVNTVPTGTDDPRDMLFEPTSNRIYVTDADQNRILIFDATTYNLINTINLSSVPGTMVFSPLTNRLFAGAYVIDLNTNTVVFTLTERVSPDIYIPGVKDRLFTHDDGLYEAKDYATWGWDLNIAYTGSGSPNVIVDPDDAAYPDGTMVNLTGQDKLGTKFVGWSGDITGVTPTLVLTMDRDINLIAAFDIVSYPIQISQVGGSGTVFKTPDKAEYPYGEQVSLNAFRDPGSLFNSWGGDVITTANPIQVTMDMTKTLVISWGTAYPLIVNQTGNGDGSCGVNDFDLRGYYANGHFYIESGAVATITTNPNNNTSNFVSWSGDASGAATSVQVTMDSTKTVTCTINLKTFPLNASVEGSGVVTKTPDQAAYDYGSNVSIAAAPTQPHWYFSHWNGDAGGSDNPLQVTVDATKSITATFKPWPGITVNIDGPGAVTKNPDQPDYAPGSTVELTATPDNEATFSHWSGDASGSANPLQVVMTSTKVITAHFKPWPRLTVDIGGEGQVTKTPDQASYAPGTIVQLRPNGREGKFFKWYFDGWRGPDGAKVDATGSPHEIQVDEDMEIRADFKYKSFYPPSSPAQPIKVDRVVCVYQQNLYTYRCQEVCNDNSVVRSWDTKVMPSGATELPSGQAWPVKDYSYKDPNRDERIGETINTVFEVVETATDILGITGMGTVAPMGDIYITHTFTVNPGTNGLGAAPLYAVDHLPYGAEGYTDDIVYVGTSSGLSKSSDGGYTFSTKTTANGLGGNLVRDIASVGAKVYALTDGGLSISNDYGETFVNQSLGYTLTTVAVYEDNIYIATEDAGLLVSNDGGVTFTLKTTDHGLASLTINNLYVQTDSCYDQGWVYVATYNGVSLSTNNGQAFVTFTTDDGLPSNLINDVATVCKPKPQIFFASEDAGLIVAEWPTYYFPIIFKNGTP
jgi:DNA-binding beta-propeller fold protein YncE